MVRIFDEDEPSRNLYVVDAQTGAILTSYNELDTVRDRQIHDANHDTRLPGTLRRSEGRSPTGDRDTDDAYDFLGDTYDYFFNNFGRDSYDERGAQMRATVHYDTNYRNAFWNGQQMVFGDGFTVDDVTAHELTHAVTECSAGLIYRFESSALNESFSDIFGETVDLINGEGTDTGDVDWLLGEDLPIGEIRDMADPTRFGHPDMSSKFLCTRSDNGGVHINSAIPNKAAYLMTVGATFNGRDIRGIGLDKMGQVHYRALTTYLTPSSSFVDDYNALNQACQDLIIPGVTTPDDCDQVKEALLAVEMDIAPVCGGDDGWETAYVDLFESQSDLDILREYRDEFLMKTRKGRLYTRLLYKYSEEALEVLLANPELMPEAAHLITENPEAVSDVLAGHEGVIHNSREISSFLKAFTQRSPRALRFWTNIIRWEIRMERRWGRPFLGFMLE
ncbi:MAG: hypothetical protein GTN81_11805 [Proteobacteria bacterium]|nr:hypothetical protein [Pseudomonadota bacterium]